ncbi:MAG TPA: hypothetical protein VM846_15995 [Vicinamibacterales bacterium]|nr:hypothetical protein [Vicinamibacterales bacterium]
MKPVMFCLLLVVAVSAAQEKQTFTGIITDDMCPLANHSRMQMGPTDAECTKACIAAHGAVYVLYDGTSAYVLSDQKAPEKFAAQRVRVVGALDPKTKTIRVDSIAAAQ